VAATTLSDGFTDVTKGLDAIRDRVDFVVDRTDLGDGLLDAVALRNQVDALVAQLGLAATNNLVAAEDGQRTIGQYVAARTNNPSVEVNRLTNLAKWLRDFRTLGAAFGGELSAAHVSYLRKHLDNSFETRIKLMGDQQFFVDTAATCSFKGFTQACDYWLVIIDPDGKEPIDQINKSSFRIGKGQGGRGELSGTCDAVTGQEIRSAVEREAERLRRADKEAGIDRTDAQRHMAALHALVVKGSARQDGTHPTPLGNIVMSQKVAEWALESLRNHEAGEFGDLTDPDAFVPVAPNDVDGRCELIDGTPIHPFLAVAALGLICPNGSINTVTLRRYVMQADSRLLDVSVNTRIFPEWMRSAAFVQSRGQCETFGCDAPHHWMQADHIHPTAHGGQTSFEQVQTQCRPDNQAKGATPGLKAWRDREPPPRRNHRNQQPAANTDSDDNDG